MDKSLREMVCMMSIWWMCAWMLEGEGVVSSLPVKGETPMCNVGMLKIKVILKKGERQVVIGERKITKQLSI